MQISFDQAKRAQTLEERGLDFAEAYKLFEGPNLMIVSSTPSQDIKPMACWMKDWS